MTGSPEIGSGGTMLKRTVGSVGGTEMSLAYVGDALCETYFELFVSDTLFGAAPRRSTVESWSPARSLPSGAGDLVVRARATGDPPSEAAVAVMPARVNMVVNVAEGHGPTKVERQRQRRRVNSFDYSFELSTDTADYDFFYDRMHVPAMADRHARRARSVDRDEAFENLFRQGFLFFVCSRGVRVAGILCHVVGDSCRARLVGWLDGDRLHLRREALKTAMHFLIEWTRSSGFRTFDLMGCEPFLTKGTFQSKRRLGATVTIPGDATGNYRVELEVRRDSRVLREFLVTNPPLVQDADGSIGAAYFHDRYSVARTDIPYACRGIDFVRLVDFDLLLTNSRGG
jgi:hypothetical protein